MGTVTAHRGLEQVRRTLLFPPCRGLHVGLHRCFRVAFLLSLFLYGCFCSSHTHTHPTDAQLISNPCCAALTQLSPTQEERTKVWRCMLWNIWWDLQDVCLQIMMRRRWGDAAVYVTHMMMHLLLDLSSSPGWFCTRWSCIFFFLQRYFKRPDIFLKVLIKFHLILIYRNLFNCLFAKVNLEVRLFRAHEFKKVLESLILLF